MPKGFPPDLKRRTVALLLALEAADSIEELRNPSSNRLEKLVGDRSGQHSVRINKQWRICFSWTNEGAQNVEFVDYH
ncbi:MAG: type II toxin-antitoxin system RelE/ParE family toxin [Pseudomonadota bacterium]